MENKSIENKINEKRGYNLLLNKFFVETKRSNSNELETLYFESFDDYYEYLDGNIYSKSCYLGFVFSDELVAKYRIRIKKLNFVAYTTKQIDSKYFDQEVLFDIEKNKKRVINFEALIKLIRTGSRTNVEKCIKRINKEYWNLCNTNYYSIASVIDVLLNKVFNAFPNSTYDFFESAYISNTIQNTSILSKMFFTCGYEKSVEILTNLLEPNDNSRFSKKIKKDIEKIHNLFSSNKIIKTNVFYNAHLDLYVVVKFYEFDFIKFDYYNSFEDLAEYLYFDLSNVDLSDVTHKSIDLSKCTINETTKLPTINSRDEYAYEIYKYFKNGLFYVQETVYKNGDKINDNYFCTKYFCDFLYYLANDISDADLVMCNGIENIGVLKNVKIENIKVRSNVMDKLNIKYENLPIKKPNEVLQYDEENQKELMVSYKDDYSSIRDFKFDYFTDIHLMHKYINNGCKTENDIFYVNKIIAKPIIDSSFHIKLLGGDICTDINYYWRFIDTLKCNNYSKYFITLGNHELRAFEGKTLNEIIEYFRNKFSTYKNFHFLHNNLYIQTDGGLYELTTSQLRDISVEGLRKFCFKARFAIFGGIGFAGKEPIENANKGYYGNIINREQEIQESKDFTELYKKVCSALYDKNVVVLTHFPIQSWLGSEEIVDGFIYVNGHNHRNRVLLENNKRIYSDNQSGYKAKIINKKTFSFDEYTFNIFDEFKDGVHIIDRNEYTAFYKGQNLSVTFNREVEKVYMLKNNGFYMFITKLKEKETLYLLNGGNIKKLSKLDINYYYNNLYKYSLYLKKRMRKYFDLQKKVSDEIKSIGGAGTIHGAIVDVDFNNHLYINPIDGSIIPYFAYDIVEKVVFRNIPSLLKYSVPELYSKYEDQNKNLKFSVILNTNDIVSDQVYEYRDTDIYRMSNVIKKIQYTERSNIIRYWDENLDFENNENLEPFLLNLIDK